MKAIWASLTFPLCLTCGNTSYLNVDDRLPHLVICFTSNKLLTYLLTYLLWIAWWTLHLPKHETNNENCHTSFRALILSAWTMFATTSNISAYICVICKHWISNCRPVTRRRLQRFSRCIFHAVVIVSLINAVQTVTQHYPATNGSNSPHHEAAADATAAAAVGRFWLFRFHQFMLCVVQLVVSSNTVHIACSSWVCSTALPVRLQHCH